ncbi:hypothetical protein X566_20200 [Afipia sp. P52-10]|uniref:hypothetical protein n=1 Tax=Afipia sp. P52-10 TaxID=1429916 RepID=UPI0003DF0C8F|nr:hypothetical protein [Afipia sp. P52-10]ETR75920.1 hypothetical protein X566_20200 [Afipia sp. P52-10]
MVKRVLMRGGISSALRVSLPGFDVETANLSQLAFDARFANLQVYTKGAVTIGGGNVAYSFSFGETLPAAPLGFFVFNVFNPGDGNLRGQMPFIVKSTSGGPITVSCNYASVSPSGFTLQTSGGSGVVYYIFYRMLNA